MRIIYLCDMYISWKKLLKTIFVFKKKRKSENEKSVPTFGTLRVERIQVKTPK